MDQVRHGCYTIHIRFAVDLVLAARHVRLSTERFFPVSVYWLMSCDCHLLRYMDSIASWLVHKPRAWPLLAAFKPTRSTGLLTKTPRKRPAYPPPQRCSTVQHTGTSVRSITMMKSLALMALVVAASPLARAANIDVTVLNFALNLEYLEVRLSYITYLGSILYSSANNGRASTSRGFSCTGHHTRRSGPLPRHVLTACHACPRRNASRLITALLSHVQANFYSCAAYGKPIDKSLWGPNGVEPIGCKKGEAKHLCIACIPTPLAANTHPGPILWPVCGRVVR